MRVKHSCYKFLSTAFICGVFYASAIDPGIKTVISHAYHRFHPEIKQTGIQVIPKMPETESLEHKLTEIVQDAVSTAMQGYTPPTYSKSHPKPTTYSFVKPPSIVPTYNKKNSVFICDGLEDPFEELEKEEQKQKKKGFFSKLFKRKNKKDKESDDSS
jgi:hypothetical protein